MDEIIYLGDLECYKNATPEMQEHPLMSPNRGFDLSKIQTENVAQEIKDFIIDRGKKLTPLSIRADLYPFNLACDFLNTTGSDISTFKDINVNDMEKKAKVWLLKNQKKLSQKRYRTATGTEEITDAELIKYLRKICDFINKTEESFDYESDRWYLADIPIVVKVNPTKSTKSISFKKIPQDGIKSEIKKVIYIHLSRCALGTVEAEMTAINRFCLFLSEQYAEVTSLKDVDRDLLEKYLIHTNTVAKGRKSYSKELCHLKSVLVTAGKILESKDLETLFYADDISKVPSRLYKVYSDAELKRLNAAIVERDPQVARALMIHQLLGTRISETLTLKRNSLYQSETGNWMMKIHQIKTGKDYSKAVNDDIKKLFEKACEYTKEKYGDTEYVFVTDKEPQKPMQYSRIQYQLMAMITSNNLVDDSGVRFGVGTHIWRHCYGKRLTELHVDDVTIAKLMGHANTSNLKHYRKVGNEMLSNETRIMRQSMDEIIENIMKEW